MYGFGGGISKKDDSKLGFGSSLGNVGGVFGKASNTLRNEGEKAENFFFGHHGKNAETHTEASEDILGLGRGGRISLGTNAGKSYIPNLPRVSSITGNSGNSGIDNANIPEAKIPKSPMEASLSLPSLSVVGGKAKNNLEKAGGAIENTGKKAVNWLFGGGKTENAPSGPSLGIGNLNANAPTLGFDVNSKANGGNLGSIKTNATSTDISLGAGKSSLGGSLSLPSLSTVGGKAKHDLEKAGGAIENTGKKAVNWLFGGGKTENAPSGPSLGIGNLNANASSLGINVNAKAHGGNLGSIKANATSTDISLGEGKSSLGGSLSLPSLSAVGSKAKHDLEKAGGAIENTGKKAINWFFGGGKTETTPSGPSLGIENLNANAPSLGIDVNAKANGGNLGSIEANTTSIDIPLGKEKSPFGASFSLPSLSVLGGKAKNDLQKAGGAIENTGKKALNWLFGGGGKGEPPPETSTDTTNGILDLNETSNAGPDYKNIVSNSSNLDKVSIEVENAGKNATEKDSSGLPLAMVNKGIPTNTSPLDVALGRKVNGTIGVPTLQLGEKNITGGSIKKPVQPAAAGVDLPKLEGSFTGDLVGIKANNTSIDISLRGSANLSPSTNNTGGDFQTNSLELGSKMKNDFSENMNGITEFPKLNLDEIDDDLTETTYINFSTTEFEKFNPSFENDNVKLNRDNKNMTEKEGKQTESPNNSDGITGDEFLSENESITNNYSRSTDTDSSELDSSFYTEESDENTEVGISSSYDITTESENNLKKIEEILRGRSNVNLPSASIEENTTNKENHVTVETEDWTPPPTEDINSEYNSTLHYVYSITSTTEKTNKSKPVVIPPFFRVPNSNASFGEEFLPEFPPSVFDNPTGKKAPFIPVLPSSTNNPMGIYNLTDRGVNSNPTKSLQQSSDLPVVTYGAIGIATIAIISIIIAFIYKAIKKATSSSSGGSYSPKSQHKENSDTRRSSNSEDNEASRAIADAPVETNLTHAVINETSEDASSAKKNSRNVKSRAPNPHKMTDENTQKDSDFSHQEASNIEILDTELASDSQEQSGVIQQNDDIKNEKSTDATQVAHGQQTSKKNEPSINKPPRKTDRAINSKEKFTSDKTAASNLNEGCLRSLGQALGGILKDHGKQKMESSKAQKEEKDSGNDSAELISCTPPTTPTDLSDQEIRKNDKKTEDQKTTKENNVVGGDAEGDTFFSSGETELDTGSEYFSADESSYATKDATAVKPAYIAPDCQSSNSNINPSNGNHVLRQKVLYDTEIVSEDGRKRSIEEDISNSLNTQNDSEIDATVMEHPHKERLINTASSEVRTRQRGITMCEDKLIAIEVHEILRGKEPYQPPSEESSVEEDDKKYEFKNIHEENTLNSGGILQTNQHDNKNHQIISGFSSDEVILKEINLKDLPRNAHLQQIIKPGESSISHSNSGLNPDSVVNEILKTSRLDFVDTESSKINSGIVENICSTEPQESRSVNSKEESSNINHGHSFLNGNNSTAQDSWIQSKRINELSSDPKKLVEGEIPYIEDNLREMHIDSSQVSGNTGSNREFESLSSAGSLDNVQRNLIDFIVPKNESLLIQATNLNRNDRLREEQKEETKKKDFAATSNNTAEIESAPPKWYVPFESVVQELPDPTRGNSDGLYIALSEETKSPLVEAETETQQHTTCLNQSSTEDSNLTSGSPKRSVAYITINGGAGSTKDEGWPDHLPKIIYGNGGGARAAIHEEKADTYSPEAGAASPVKSESVITSQDTSELLSRQYGVSNTNTLREKIQGNIPQFELPNMDKRLMKKRKLKRRQIKSLDSGVHSYYGEYMDLVEFPEIEAGQELTREEAPETTGAGEEGNSSRTTCIQSEITEIEIEEDVVTILPDGTIREEKIVIDKISST